MARNCAGLRLIFSLLQNFDDIEGPLKFPDGLSIVLVIAMHIIIISHQGIEIKIMIYVINIIGILI